ncbi:PH domain-containing protein [Halobacillus salinarum]|uniref:PH domain-containing protein n=1 Tax=Halobacillus salinarum TaxID=2932257 RepID=A0ABY4EHY9_9BACI|nr:PH domain-containing protein [Halobacillus salinarum]UOQ43610.1 PH domain-containing protein [Halobacillus salinarum]
MREPNQRISERALLLWRIYGGIQTGAVVIAAIALQIMIQLWDWPAWLVLIPLGLILLLLIFSVWLIPSIRWKRWRYEVSDVEIELQHGLFIVTRTLVPMVRVQHVDTEQGPLLRKYRLATISISTAATVHKVPALDEREAERLRQSISSLARVAEEDV